MRCRSRGAFPAGFRLTVTAKRRERVVHVQMEEREVERVVHVRMEEREGERVVHVQMEEREVERTRNLYISFQGALFPYDYVTGAPWFMS